MESIIIGSIFLLYLYRTLKHIKMKKLKDLWLGKEVQIYPGDTHKKFGTIVDVSPLGFTFLITRSDKQEQYEVGQHYFIGVGSKLTFKEV